MLALHLEIQEQAPLKFQKQPRQFSKVFVVDDNHLHLAQTAETLNATRFAKEIVCMTSAKKALNYVRTAERLDQIPEIIFLSFDMNDLNGQEFLRKFNELSDFTRNHCRIVIMSSYNAEAERKNCLLHRSVSQYYVKPLNVNHLSEFNF